jgi:hypothetical protein
MKGRKSIALAGLGALALLGIVVAAGLAAVSPANRLGAVLRGNDEVPQKGDPNGRAEARITLKGAKKKVCFNITYERIDAPTAGHIHKGAEGVAGAIKVPLFEEPGGATAQPIKGCEGDVSRKLIRRIRNHPERWYVNLHNGAYPDGAVRGQLGLRSQVFH